MADFQDTIRMQQAEGWVGGLYSNMLSAPVTSYVADVPITIGTFVFNKNQNANYAARLDPRRVGYQASGGTQPSCGIAVRIGNIGVVNPIGVGGTDTTNIVPAGFNVEVASVGEYLLYVPEVAAGTATVGMQLICTDVTTGAVGAVADGTEGAEGWWIVEIFDGATPGLCGVSSYRKG